MDLLVCGMHRSGTSAAAHLLAASCGRSMLEDPDWAMTGRLIDVRAQAAELASYDMLKCPRMTEVLPEALSAYPDARAVVMVRDPRDVASSILEKVRAGMPTRMFEFSRLGVAETGVAGFARAYGIYARTIAAARDTAGPGRVRLVGYERFSRDRPGTVAAAAAWLGWPFDEEVCRSLESRQLAPAGTKHASDQSIKGAGRWRTDLDAVDREALVPAVTAYEELSGLVVHGGPR